MDKLDELEIANGKQDLEKHKQLEQLLSINKINPFGTSSLEVFEDNMKGYTQADMQRLAERVGVNPYLDRARLKTTLFKEFKAQNKNNRGNLLPQPIQSVVLDPNNPQHAKTIKILGEFR